MSNPYRVVNFHITNSCNYTCRYCFGKFEGRCYLPLEDTKRIIVKNKAALTLQENAVKVQLTQEETALFTAPGTALLQLRAYKSEYDAPGSRMWAIPVYPTNNEEILS